MTATHFPRLLSLLAVPLTLLSAGACTSSKSPQPVVSAPPKKVEADFRTATIGFYNLENLFDTENDPKTSDDDLTPTSYKNWDDARYRTKLTNLASVITELGAADGPDVLGVIELENRRVLDDLVAQPALASRKYQIAHFDSPDPRGIDVALLYKPEHFTVKSQRPIRMSLPDTTMGTRDLLLVDGVLNGEPITFMVCHWPSRRGGQKALNRRISVAQQSRRAIDEQLKANPQARILMMGDLNDSPTDSTVEHVLGAGGDLLKLPKSRLYNAFYDLQVQGKGTMYYRNRPDVFDMMVLSAGLLTRTGLRYKPGSAGIYSPDRLTSPQTKFPGEPLGTYIGRKYIGGYSDHFPVYLTLLTK